MSTTLDSFLGSEGDAVITPVATIEQLEQQSAELYAAEEATLQTNPEAKNAVAAIRAARADRIKRQKEYLALEITNETINVIESLSTDKQKWAALEGEKYLSDFKDMNFSLQAWVAEEKALDQAKTMGQVVLLNAQFAAERSRDRRKVQAEAVKRLQDVELQKNQDKLNQMRAVTVQKKAERDQKYKSYLTTLPCMVETYMPERGVFIVQSAGLTTDYIYICPTNSTMGAGFTSGKVDIPFIVRACKRSESDSTGVQGIFILKSDYMNLAKKQVLENPAFYFNMDRWFAGQYPETPVVFNRSYGGYPFSATPQGMASFDYLAKAILDECFPFYEDYASGTKPYPHFISYGENIAWPNPEQWMSGIYKILGVGEFKWGQEQIKWLQRLSNINSDPNAPKNYVFNAPQNVKYHHPKIVGSLPPYPIQGKMNAAYKPWMMYKYIYGFDSENDAKIYYEQWVLPQKGSKLSAPIDWAYALASQEPGAANYIYRNLESIRNTRDGANAVARMGALYNAASSFQQRYPHIYNKVVGKHLDYNQRETRDIYSYYRDDEYFNNKAFPERATYLNTHKGYDDVFPEEGPFNMTTFYSTRPKTGFIYIPKVGYINPLLVLNMPMVSIASPDKYYQSRASAIQRMNEPGLLQKFVGLIKNVLNPATAVSTLFPGAAQSSFGRYLISSTQTSGLASMFMINAMAGENISREQSKAMIAMVLQGLSIAATAGTAGAAVAVASTAVTELSKMGLANTDFGKALLTIAQAVVVSSAASTSFASALSASMEREAKNQLVRAIVKSTDMEDSIIGVIAIQAIVEVAGDATLQRDWTNTLVDVSKKGAMKYAATQIPGGQYLVQAAMDVYNEGWDSILPTIEVDKILQNPADVIAGIDWKKIGNKLTTALKDKGNQQTLLMIATGKVSPEQLAKGFVEAKLAEDLAKKTAMVDVARNPNDPGVQAAAKLTNEIQLARRRNEVLAELAAGRKPRKEDLRILNPMAEYYWNIIKEIVPDGQQVEALNIGLKIGMPDVKNYLKFTGPKLNLPSINLPDLDLPKISMPSLPSLPDMPKLPSISGFNLPGSNLQMDIPFSVPKLTLMELGIKLPTLPNIAPDRLRLPDLPKLNIKLDSWQLERISKDILPKNVKLDPVFPTEGQAHYNIIDFNGDMHISPKLKPSIYEHSMLTYGHVPRHETPEQKLYNLVRETEIKLAMVEIQKAEAAMAAGDIVV